MKKNNPLECLKKRIKKSKNKITVVAYSKDRIPRDDEILQNANIVYLHNEINTKSRLITMIMRFAYRFKRIYTTVTNKDDEIKIERGKGFSLPREK